MEIWAFLATESPKKPASQDHPDALAVYAYLPLCLPTCLPARLEPITLCYYAFEQCSKIQPIMLKIMLSKSRLCSRADCFIRVYLRFLTAVLE